MPNLNKLPLNSENAKREPPVQMARCTCLYIPVHLQLRTHYLAPSRQAGLDNAVHKLPQVGLTLWAHKPW
jgi:hypothetical protein